MPTLQPIMPESPAMTLEEAGAYIRGSRSTLYRLIKEGRIAAIKQRRRTLITVDSLKSYMASLQPAGR